jgi:enoyl-CoA hydratase/carnithine racemase
MQQSVIKTKQDAATASITIDRPAEGNALTVEMLAELAAAVRHAGATEAKVIVLRSTGDVFSRGRDVRGARPAPTALAVRDSVVAPILDVYDALANAPQPIVCAVQGLALGFGCALATACDVTIASEKARFRLPEMEKDLPPTLAISAMMARVHRKALTWMVYSMQELDARAALDAGLVSHVVPADQLDAAVGDLTAQLSQRSREALVAVKDYFRSAPQMEARGAADYAGNLLSAVLASARK